MKTKSGMVSCIVSSYDRPMYLNACLASLAVQAVPHETLVCVNATDAKMVKRHLEVVKRYEAKAVLTGKMGSRCCYSSAEIAAEEAEGEWLWFGSDDSLVGACFLDLMLRAAKEQNVDFVHCDVAYDPPARIGRPGRYCHLSSRPALNEIDKTNFIMKKKWFKGFPGKRLEGPVGADFLMVEDALRRGMRHGKAEGILLFHQ